MIRIAQLELGFLVAHAPHSQTKEAVRVSWWAELTRVQAQLLKSHPVQWVSLIDANGRVGSVPCRSVGPSQPERENSNGSFLRTFADQFHLRLSNTWG